jgi:hypothetical protein
MRGRAVIRHRLKFTGLIFVAFLLSGLTGAGAQSACFDAPLAGTWVNADADIQDLVKLRIIYQCTQEETESGLIVPGARWYVRAWAKCYPANCAWGLIRARIGPKGNLQASFSTFSADRFLQIKMNGEKISVQVIVNYRDARRQNLDEKVPMTRKGG